MNYFSTQFALALLMAMLVAGDTWAADVPVPEQTVQERARPELEPLGVRLGAFLAKPVFELTYADESNIFAQQANEVDDTIWLINPSVGLHSNWSRHSLTESIGANLGRYSSNSSEDFNDVTLRGSLSLDIGQDSGLEFSAAIQALHEDRFSPDDANGEEPAEFDRNELGAKFLRRSGKLRLRVGADLSDFDFDDVPAGSTTIDNDDRDRQETRGSVRLGYLLSPEFEAYITGGVDERDYDQRLDNAGVGRSSDGTRVAIGGEFDLASGSSLDAYVGTTERNYDDPGLATTDAVWFGGEVGWNLSGLTTVTAYASRDIEETTLLGASGFEQTRFGIRVDHELRRHIILHGELASQTNDYDGIDREDDLTLFRLGVDYFFNRNLGVRLRWSQRERDAGGSNSGNNDYDIDRIGLTIIARR